MSGFSSFVDHYILLLAARYHAPVEDEEAAAPGHAEADAAWQQVARALQHALHGPLTAEERREMRLVDVSLFTAPIVRQRAQYLRWHYAEKAGQERRERRAKRGAPHPFDITRDSIKTDVEAIYAVVRAQLPSTLVVAVDETDSETEEEDVDENKIRHRHANPERAPLAPVELPAYLQASAADQQRDAAFGLARDAFLTTIQKLQADFYQTHKRWVDVPGDVLDRPAASRVGATPPGNKRPSLHEERERLELLMALNGSGPGGTPDDRREAPHAADGWQSGGQNPREVIASVREQLMRATNTAAGRGGAKPMRPSTMTNEEMEQYYMAQTALPSGGHRDDWCDPAAARPRRRHATRR
ncbi:hypothetical protein STCU_06889 [Strigomonas culicis]|uniref:Uncharacterized protein n=1 Tax=Strigomonas culicis TaxID=28005 RepID=S9U7Z7_9TRYP|nr:hypothetical protein STCU_06889 [Strigomonas culicis]|eukprot:EPY25008.1 hypothetical protein STCU_06889 [Strigomonas culicis]